MKPVRRLLAGLTLTTATLLTAGTATADPGHGTSTGAGTTIETPAADSAGDTWRDTPAAARPGIVPADTWWG